MASPIVTIFDSSLYSNVVWGQYIKEYCQKLVESMAKRVAKLLSFHYCIRFIKLLNLLC